MLGLTFAPSVFLVHWTHLHRSRTTQNSRTEKEKVASSCYDGIENERPNHKHTIIITCMHWNRVEQEYDQSLTVQFCPLDLPFPPLRTWNPFSEIINEIDMVRCDEYVHQMMLFPIVTPFSSIQCVISMKCHFNKKLKFIRNDVSSIWTLLPNTFARQTIIELLDWMNLFYSA